MSPLGLLLLTQFTFVFSLGFHDSRLKRTGNATLRIYMDYPPLFSLREAKKVYNKILPEVLNTGYVHFHAFEGNCVTLHVTCNTMLHQ